MGEVGRLEAVLEEARRRGFLGPGPVEGHLRHAQAYARVRGVAEARSAVDLGSGGGVPGLVLASELVDTRWVFLDAHRGRTSFLGDAVVELGLSARVTVLTGRAEAVGRDQAHRGRYDLVVSRAFGPPAVVAECAAPLLRVGGRLVVSEPPDHAERWPAAGLGLVGLGWDALDPGPPRLASMVQLNDCPDRFPRRVGIPAKRPLW